MKIGIIGCGNMGQALLKGIISKSYTNRRNILISDKDRKKRRFIQVRFKVKVANSNRELIENCGVIILAVKPQDLNDLFRDIACSVSLEGKLFISICAGISTSRLQRHLGKLAIVRIMPNMPGQIQEAISAISLGKYATQRDKMTAKAIFSCIGEVIEIKERLMNAVTAISGSGPAYFFYLTEKLIEMAKKLGIPSQVAQRLAIKTALGSARLMDTSKQSLQSLKKRVMSKGGTTEAAFNVFRTAGLDRVFNSAVQAAANRAKQLSSARK